MTDDASRHQRCLQGIDMRSACLAALIAAATCLAPSAARAQFCPGVNPWVFDDVEASDPFCGFITWMAQAQITGGCSVIDANHRLYCPNGSVTRTQMAAFMFRLGDTLFPTTCAAGQVMKWNGTDWACANDATASSGTVTSIAAGTGLQATPNPITSSGSLAIASTYQLPQACAANQVPKWNGAAWTCAADSNAGGTVTSVSAGAGLTGGPVTTSGALAIATGGVTAAMLAANGCVNGQLMKFNGTIWQCAADNSPVNAFVQNGNVFGAEAILGPNDPFALNFKASGVQVMRLQWTGVSPNIIGGSHANYAAFGVRGATIGGGGVVSGSNDPDYDFEGPNFVSDHYGTIGGGYANRVGDSGATLNDQPFAVIAGGAFNIASASYAAIAGGGANTAGSSYAFVGGGEQNRAAGAWSNVSGGSQNDAQGQHATIGGGRLNRANGNHSTIGGGWDNDAASSATVAGGVDNNANGEWSAIGGGSANDALADYSTVAGGRFNKVSGNYASVGGGSSNDVSGPYATSPGGRGNRASGRSSFAAGEFAFASAAHCFVWSDGIDHECTTPRAFLARATGGFFFTTGEGTGVQVGAGASFWSTLSDRRAKEKFERVDTLDVLERLARIPIERWTYKEERSGARHIGPMAQDFHAAFGVGDSDRHIGTVDADGVALAAIQGLHRLVQRQAATIEALEARLAAHEQTVAALQGSPATVTKGFRRAPKLVRARTTMR